MGALRLGADVAGLDVVREKAARLTLFGKETLRWRKAGTTYILHLGLLLQSIRVIPVLSPDW